GGHRLLGEHGDVPFKTFDDELVVSGIDRADDEHVRAGPIQHLIEVGERWAFDTDMVAREFQASRVDVAETDELGHIRIALAHGATPEAHSSDARADEIDAF